MKKIIIANWKCNPSSMKESEKIASSVKKGLNTKNSIVICPPNIFLQPLIASFGHDFLFGIQNCYYEQNGPYTGEISPKMAKASGAKYAILGHSERRALFGENDESINKKIISVLENNMIPILCIGENRGEREKGDTFKVISKQLIACLDKIPMDRAKKIIVAYEPIWAIGTGIHASEEKIIDAKSSILKILCDIYGNDIATKTKIIYGGSVNSKNIGMILGTCSMDGVLVGGASLDPKEFIVIANN
jgi:triosephosphate isomerase